MTVAELTGRLFVRDRSRLFDGVDTFMRRLILLFITLISLGPFVWLVLSTFKTNGQVLDSALSLPSSFSLNAYIEVFGRSRFVLFFVNSLVVSTVATVAAVALFGLGAYVLARFDFRGRQLIYVLLISSVLISLIPMQQPILLVVRQLGLYDTRWGLILVYAAKGLPIVIFIMHSFFRSIPREYEEAAAVDGATFTQIYSRVILPMAKPAAAAAGVLVFLNSWNEFLFALLLTQSEESRTLSYALRFFESAFSYDFPTLFAAVVLTLIPSILIYILLQEQIQRSLAGGGIRG